MLHCSALLCIALHCTAFRCHELYVYVCMYVCRAQEYPRGGIAFAPVTQVTPRAASPRWHRQLRRQRFVLRLRVRRRCKAGLRLRPLDVALLESHHSRPRYRRSGGKYWRGAYSPEGSAKKDSFPGQQLSAGSRCTSGPCWPQRGTGSRRPTFPPVSDQCGPQGREQGPAGTCGYGDGEDAVDRVPAGPSHPRSRTKRGTTETRNACPNRLRG